MKRKKKKGEKIILKSQSKGLSGRPGLEASEAPQNSHYHKKDTKGAQEDGRGRTGVVLSGRSSAQ